MRVQDLAEEFTTHRDQVHQRLDQVNESIEVRYASMEAQLREFMSRFPPTQTTNPHHSSSSMGSDDRGSLRFVKMEIPSFEGQDPNNWIFKSELFFRLQQTPDHLQVQIAGLKMDGAAGDWFQWIFNSGTVQTWEEYTKAVRRRFGSSHYRDVRGVLAKLTQIGSLADYMREFQRLMNQVHDLSDNFLMILFISGLQPDLQGAIQLHWPTSLHQAMQLTLAYDTHHSELRSSFTNSTKKSFHRPASPIKPDKPYPLTIQSSQTLALPAPSTVPVRKLSTEEIRKKRELGICFTCDEKWTAKHRCKAKMMLLIGEVEDMGEEQEEEIVWGMEEPKGNRIDATLNSLSGSNNPRSIQLQASIGKQEVSVLVDSGSSHNFIRRRLAEEIRLPMTKSSKMRVFMGSGEFLLCDRKCSNVSLNIQGHGFITDLWVIELSELNVILGMHWLTQLGKVTHDYNNLSMEFVWQGIPVQLSGCQQQGTRSATAGMQGACNTIALQPIEEAQAKEIAYLGHVVTVSGVKADPRKLSAITDWPIPQSTKQLRAFLGLTGYYRRFVQHYASIAHPLTELLKQDRFSWTKGADASFHKLKISMATTPVLHLPDFSSSFVIESDASSFGVGAVLLQKGQPVSFFSKKLGVRLAAASTYVRELYALTEAVKRWRHYLLGSHFVIRTDHQSLRQLLTQTIQTPEQQKYMSKLLGYSFSIEYKSGLSNVMADSLSRQHGANYCFNLDV
ncbi:uncharacterized protein LOC133298012 [Gastrolobium bilobum]|uniref:uncharacterized protein LOC133298012 n=1 Tax=Gastrolobium bilobum TaxID=150636 RepID=UPI002AB20C24|nr:uncharacterized protein LOC133298012 [Gastrolobium bilobum]